MTSVHNLIFIPTLAILCSLHASASAQQFAPAPAPAQAEDTITTCPLITSDLQKLIGNGGKGDCKVFCTGCGCRGGPGYRGPKGDCVGYANIIQVCGPPPHDGCTRECALVRPGCNGRVWLKAFAAAAGLAVTFVPLEQAATTEVPTSPGQDPDEKKAPPVAR